MKRIYTVALRDTRGYDSSSLQGLMPFDTSTSILVVARSFTEAIEETQKRYGPRYEVVGVQLADQRTSGPRDILV